VNNIASVIADANRHPTFAEHVALDVRPLRSRPGTWCASIRTIIDNTVLTDRYSANAFHFCSPSMESAILDLDKFCGEVLIAA
jgi:hypothetical protein